MANTHLEPGLPAVLPAVRGCLFAVLLLAALPAVAQQADLPSAPSPAQTANQPLGKSGIAGLPDQPMQSARDAQAAASNPSGLSWDDVKARFFTQNPTLAADASGVEETR